MRYRRVALVVIALLAVLAAEWAWLSHHEDPAAGPKSIAMEGQLALSGGTIGLIDQAGQPFTDKRLRGKLRIVVFGYTHCPDVCPTTLSRVAHALDLLGPEAKLVQPVFITLDPERDSAPVLRDYVTAIDPRFIALTGPLEAIKAVAEVYRVYFAKVGDGADYLLDHSAYIYLVAPDGAMAAYLPHDKEPRALARQIERALAKRR